ncbi:MAG: DNA polymerase [Bacilli bacterium]
MTSLYNTRLEYKKLNPPLANFCKIVMNAGYGKFGQRPFENVIFNTKEIPVGDIIVDRNTQYKKLKNKNMLFEFWGIDYSIVEKIRLKTTKNISVASYITSVGRCNLLKAMISIGFENIAYTDTDSIYLINAPKNIDKIIQISEKKLGD